MTFISLLIENMLWLFVSTDIKCYIFPHLFSQDVPFQEDMDKIDEYEKAVISWNTSIFVSLIFNKLGKIVALRVISTSSKNAQS